MAAAALIHWGAGSVATARAQQTFPQPTVAADHQIAVPPPDVLLMLIRTTLVALNQANFTGNYTVLHGLGTPTLQARNTPADLGTAFADLRARSLDLSPVLVLSPTLNAQPLTAADGTLRLSGSFPTTPLQVDFAMAFLPVGNRWRIDALSVGVSQAPPRPEPPPQPPQTPPASDAPRTPGAAAAPRDKTKAPAPPK